MTSHHIDEYIVHLSENTVQHVAISTPGQSMLPAVPTRMVLDNNFGLIGLAMEFMRLVIFGSSTSFVDRSPKCRFLALTRLGKMFRHLRDFAELYAAGYSFHPLLRFFFEQYREDPISRLDEFILAALGRFDLALYDEFDGFLEKLRSSARAEKLPKRIRDWESKYEKNLISLKKIQVRIFKRFSRVVVVRLDLAHAALRFTPKQLAEHETLQRARQAADRAAYFTQEELYPTKPAKPIEGTETAAELLPARVSFETVQRDRLRLFANMKGKPSLFKHAVAYAWRMEFTPDAGYHLHLVLFFDGSKVQKHAWYAEQIGEYWRDKITRGAGYFYNCNRAWSEQSPKYALGQVDHGDTRKRQNLESALEYLCKRTQQVVVMPHKNCNMFGSGFFHREKKAGPGRPRTKVPAQLSNQGTAVGKRYPKSSIVHKINKLRKGGV